MKYLFELGDLGVCKAVRRELEENDISCEVRNACEFPDGTQGPELWVRDEDYDRAKRLFILLQNEA